MLVSLSISCARKTVLGGRKQFLPWWEGLRLACLLLLPFSSSQVCKFMSLNYPHSPALAEAFLPGDRFPISGIF